MWMLAPFLKSRKNTTGIHFCTSIVLTLSELAENLICLRKFLGIDHEKCYVWCHKKCSEVVYSTRASSSQWPLQFKSFFKHVMEFGNYSRITDAISQINNKFNSTDDRLVADQLQKRLIEENFAKIDFVMSSDVNFMYEEVPKYSLFSFIGTVGGALNLWTGITVVVALEIIEGLS